MTLPRILGTATEREDRRTHHGSLWTHHMTRLLTCVVLPPVFSINSGGKTKLSSPSTAATGKPAAKLAFAPKQERLVPDGSFPWGSS